MSKSYHKHAKKFDDDFFEDDEVEAKMMKKLDRFTRQMKKLKLEDRDPDT